MGMLCFGSVKDRQLGLSKSSGGGEEEGLTHVAILGKAMDCVIVD